MRILLLLTIFFIHACGFTPVYSPSMNSGALQTELSSITVDTIPNREGQMVRNHLIDRLYKKGTPGSPDYRLTVSPIIERAVEIGIDKDDEASRSQLREITNIRLIRLSDNKILLERTVRSVSSYNILTGQFTTFVTRQDARNQALRALSDNIMTELEIYFNR